MLLAEQLLAVALVLSLLGLAVWALGKGRGLRFPGLRRKAEGSNMLAVIEKTPLTAQHALHLVRLGDQTVLVATFPGGIAFHPGENRFAEVFRSALSKPGEPSK